MEGKLIRPRETTPEERAAHLKALAKDCEDAFVEAVGAICMNEVLARCDPQAVAGLPGVAIVRKEPNDK